MPFSDAESIQIMKRISAFLCSITIAFCVLHCKEKDKQAIEKSEAVESVNTAVATPTKETPLLIDKPNHIQTPKNMVWITGGTFKQGAVPQDKMAMSHEKPAHDVSVDGFFMDITEVTNAQFKKFVDATGYKTIAERAVDWQEMKKQLPEGTPKPHDSILQPGSLTFKKTKTPIENLYDFLQWWQWTIGANWKKPRGPESSIDGKENEPVVQIAYEDAQAYCKWANRRLPTEAEWEKAARGNQGNSIYFWGDDVSELPAMANSWEGLFPFKNLKNDGYEYRAKVKSYAPNDFGLYDMAGNVWEWTSDWYHTNYYKKLANQNEPVRNPKGASSPFNAQSPYAKEKVMKGGSFLCNASYCASYRISARMATSTDSSLEHLGFRTVVTVAMLENSKVK